MERPALAEQCAHTATNVPPRNRAHSRIVPDDDDDDNIEQDTPQTTTEAYAQPVERPKPHLKKSAPQFKYAATRTNNPRARIISYSTVPDLDNMPRTSTRHSHERLPPWESPLNRSAHINQADSDKASYMKKPDMPPEHTPEPRRRRLIRGSPKKSSTSANAEDVARRETSRPPSITETDDTGPNIYEIYKKLEERIHDYEEGHCDWTKAWLRRSRKAAIPEAVDTSPPDGPRTKVSPGAKATKSTKSPFSHLRRSSVSFTGSSKSPGIHQRVVDHGVECVTYTSSIPAVPYYSHHRDMEINVLSENLKVLRVYPHLTQDADDEGVQMQIEEDLDEFHEAMPEAREQDLRNRARTRYLQPVLLAFMVNMGIKLHDLMHALLDSALPKQLPPAVESEVAKLRQEPEARKRRAAVDEGCPLNLPISAKAEVVLACHICMAISNVCKLSVYNSVKQLLELSAQAEAVNEQDMSPDSHTPALPICRICFLSYCPFHGEYPDDHCEDENSDSEVETTPPRKLVSIPENRHSLNELMYRDTFAAIAAPGIALNDHGNFSSDLENNVRSDMAGHHIFARTQGCSDTCFWKKHTFKDTTQWTFEERRQLEDLLMVYGRDIRGPCMIALVLDKTCIEIFYEARALLRKNANQSSQHDLKRLSKEEHQSRGEYIRQWQETNTDDLVKRPHTFLPCSHAGTCQEARCRCFRDNVNCEKFCRCNNDCERRFKGCECRRQGVICYNNAKCCCYVLNRECDVDLCGSCGAIEMLNPENQVHSDIGTDLCRNVGIQRSVPKRTILGSSEIAGFGLFMAEAAKEHDYLGEYKGEVISYPEGARRGASYHFQRVNYLFGFPNHEQESDATHAGSKLRYINHSSDVKYINCTPRVFLCNTVKRIGFYALRDLEPGDELLFDYGYGPEHLKPFHEKDGAQSAKVAAASGKKQRVAQTTSKKTARVSSGAPLAAAKNSTSFTMAGQQSFDSALTGQQEDSDSSSELSDVEETTIEELFKDIPMPKDDSDDEDFTGANSSPPLTPVGPRDASPDVPSTRSKRRRRAELAELGR